MQTSSNGRAIIEQFEGCEEPVKGRPGFFVPYHDEVGVLTVCYGCTNLSGTHAPIVPGAVYSKVDCDALLSSDLAGFETRVGKIMAGVALTQCEFDALVSFDFNTGGLDRSSIPRKIRDGRRAEVAPTLSRWNKAGGRVYAGLVRRRTAEGQEFDGKLAMALATAGVHRSSGDGMPQKVDRPTVPVSEVTKATGKERRAAAGGAATAGSGTVATQAPADEHGSSTVSYAGAVVALVGAVLLLIAVLLIVRKWWHLDREWA